MKKIILLFIVIAITISANGCASIVNGRRQDIVFRSSPDNATVEVYSSFGNHVATATTPAVIRFRRGRGYFRRANYTVLISKEGYQTQSIGIRSGVSGWYAAGNYFTSFAMVIGYLIVDPLTGAMWTLQPKGINTNLRQALSLNDDTDEDGIYVILKEQIPEELFASLDLVQIQ